MLRYVKGARGERELLGKFLERGYSVIRSAGSGVNSISPDIAVIRKGKGLSFECKAWENGRVAIEKEKYAALKNWQENTSMPTYIAWRMNGRGWFFIRLEEMEENEKSFSITRKKTLEINRDFDFVAKENEGRGQVLPTA